MDKGNYSSRSALIIEAAEEHVTSFKKKKKLSSNGM